MAKGQGKVAQAKTGIVARLPRACSDETAAVEFLEAQRWADTGSHCPHCGDTDVYKMTDRATGERNKRFLWLCKGCRKQFTVRVGSVYEDSAIPLRHWCYGFWAASASKKGVSSKQIQRMTGLSYKSALFMMHRIRFAMTPDFARAPQLRGTVEADETYIGGKPRYKQPRPGPRPGAKMPVLSIVERGGNIRSFVTADVTAANVGMILAQNVSRDSHLMTDSARIYTHSYITHPFARHSYTDHTKGQYALPDGTHSNTVESSFALLKRGIYGTFHNVSRKHLHRYVAEFDFRWNARKIEDGARTALAIRSASGKRLRYREAVSKATV